MAKLTNEISSTVNYITRENVKNTLPALSWTNQFIWTQYMMGRCF